MIGTRLLWIYPATYLPRFLFRAHPRARPVPAVAVPDRCIGWAGLRGAVSLAAALALPLDDRLRRALPGPRPR